MKYYYHMIIDWSLTICIDTRLDQFFGEFCLCEPNIPLDHEVEADEIAEELRVWVLEVSSSQSWNVEVLASYEYLWILVGGYGKTVSGALLDFLATWTLWSSEISMSPLHFSQQIF